VKRTSLYDKLVRNKERGDVSYVVKLGCGEGFLYANLPTIVHPQRNHVNAKLDGENQVKKGDRGEEDKRDMPSRYLRVWCVALQPLSNR
jgi:hypothetical protein